MKYIYILFALIITTNSFAQSTSTVIKTTNSNINEHKLQKIQENTENDLQIIKNEFNDWKNDFNIAANTIKNEINDLYAVVLDAINQANNKFKDTENDDAITTENFAKSNPPTCTGSKPRLIYKNNKFTCTEAFDCENLNPDHVDWVKTVDDKCVRPPAVWNIGNWGNCNANNTQTRSVTCVYKDKIISQSVCSDPKPLAIRTCTIESEEFAENCTIGTTEKREIKQNCGVKKFCEPATYLYTCTKSGWVKTKPIGGGICVPIDKACP